uniref:S-RNase n=2 Tax=Malus domestica TaxID=3750 RepID=A0A2U8LMM5_MALDO|nr:S-RNase [Malus domestica]
MGITGIIYMVTTVFSLVVLIFSSFTVGFDYFQFTQQYQPAACNSNPTPCKDPPAKLFTVHGLWPSNWNLPDPIFCKNTTITPQQIGHIEAQLEIIWPNVFNRTNHLVFWNKQWNKHGSCGYPIINDEIQYFETVIKMYIIKKQNVSKILSRAKIKPEGKNRTRTEIINAISISTNNMTPKLKCQKNNGTIELVEVTLCNDHNITKFINCRHPYGPQSQFFCPKINILY